MDFLLNYRTFNRVLNRDDDGFVAGERGSRWRDFDISDAGTGKVGRVGFCGDVVRKGVG